MKWLLSCKWELVFQTSELFDIVSLILLQTSFVWFIVVSKWNAFNPSQNIKSSPFPLITQEIYPRVLMCLLVKHWAVQLHLHPKYSSLYLFQKDSIIGYDFKGNIMKSFLLELESRYLCLCLIYLSEVIKLCNNHTVSNSSQNLKPFPLS